MTSDVLSALADPTRLRVLELLADGGDGTATTLAAQLPVTRPAVIKHLGVLDRAGLVRRRRRGREVRYVVRTEPLDETARWLDGLTAEWDQQLSSLKRLAESPDA